MLIKNARFVLTQNRKREILENVDILISNNKITKIGRKLQKNDDCIINADKKIIIPGLINSHTHSPMILFRGISNGRNLHEWLNKDIIPAEKKLNKEKVYYGALLSTLEKISTGTTTFNDMYSYNKVIIKAINKSGMRAVLGCGLKDENNPEKTVKELKKTKRLLKNIKTNKGLITPALSLHWTLTCSDKLISCLIEINEDKLPVHMHVAETVLEVKKNIKMYGKRPIERLNQLGILNENFIGAHCVHLSDKEIKILAKTKSKVVHVPTANMKLADGVCPVTKLLKEGVCLALGSDSAAANDNLNMFEEMKIASLLQKISTGKASVMDPQTTFDLATINASKTLKMNKLGSLEEGKIADLVFIDKNDITINPILSKSGLLSNLIYSFDGRVSDVIVNGKFLLKDYKFTTLNKEKIIEKIGDLL